jgi:hypothetical protein
MNQQSINELIKNALIVLEKQLDGVASPNGKIDVII